MFEVEVAHLRLTSDALPAAIREQFIQPRSITHIGHVQWEEHCTECAWPACYTSCDLYNPRNDGNCRRTVDGFSPLFDLPIFADHVVRVKFKRWGNLTGHCGLALRPLDEVTRTERRLHALSLLAARMPNLGASIGRPGLPSLAVRRLKSHSVDAAPRRGAAVAEPNCFVLEVYNPAATTVELSLDIGARAQEPQRIPFKRLLRIAPGFARVRIPFEDIRPYLEGLRVAGLRINPNILRAEDEGLTLFFGLATFVRDPSFVASKPAAAKKIKVVVWDLDNTVWNGTLIEDGPGKPALKPGIDRLIAELDRRGIVNSIASKNHENDALAELDRLGLRDYFVFPAIGWGPKSEAVRRITSSFNVGEDTVAFIDDQAFEREEVRSRNPKVRVYRVDEVDDLLRREEFDVPVTEEARNRRLFYQNDEVRQHAMQQSNGSYIEFLKQSNIRVHIAVASVEQIERIHELVQRTNQMNFSGRRYSKRDLQATLSSPRHECYLIDAEDSYGKYGYIGFAVLDPGPVPRVVDLAFSCRVQAKRVEHAVLVFLMEKYAALGAREFEVFYRASERNAQIAEVFPDLGFTEAARDGADCVYRRDISASLPENNIVAVTFSQPVRQLEVSSNPGGRRRLTNVEDIPDADGQYGSTAGVSGCFAAQSPRFLHARSAGRCGAFVPPLLCRRRKPPKRHRPPASQTRLAARATGRSRCRTSSPPSRADRCPIPRCW